MLKKGWSIAESNAKKAVDTTKVIYLIPGDDWRLILQLALQTVSMNTAKPVALFNLQPIMGLIRRHSILIFCSFVIESGLMAVLSEMDVHLLGLLDLIMLKVKLLEMLKRMCKSQMSDMAQGKPALYS